MGKYLVLILMIFVFAILGGAYYLNQQTEITPIIISPNVQKQTPEVIQTGTVSGKLCYPSEFLPEGQIVAKNTETDKIVNQDYPGSSEGGKNGYTITLPEGIYKIRYEANIDGKVSSGYHTTVCPTGSEITCADTNSRVVVPVKITKDRAVENHDLCDFYYQQESKPQF